MPSGPNEEALKNETRLREISEDEVAPVADADSEILGIDSCSSKESTPPEAMSFQSAKPKYVPLTMAEKRGAFLKFTLIPAGLLGFQYLMTPGLIAPFLESPLFRVILLAATTWMLIGAAIYCQSRGWAKVICIIVFMMPLMTIPIFGPALMFLMSH